MHTITIRLSNDLRSSLDRWTTKTRATDEEAVWLALRMLLNGEPHPPVPLTKIKPYGAEGAD